MQRLIYYAGCDKIRRRKKKGAYLMKYNGIKSLSFIHKENGELKAVVCTKTPTYEAFIEINGKIYADSFNDAEPYDRKTHVFYLPKLDCKETFFLHLKKFKHGRFAYIKRLCLCDFTEKDERKLLNEYNNSLFTVSSKSEKVCDGVTYTHTIYSDKNGAPVHAFVTEFEADCASLYVGTPNDGYESVNVRATIPDMVKAAEKNGVRSAAAVNADFFDIFGDFHPSGLCVKNGRVVANAKSQRNFIAKLKDGSHVITNKDESPDIINDIEHAASGLQMIVKDGEIYEYAPLEPFSYTRHPRTAVGIRKNGSVILLVVDGRIPEYSNGASLVDLATLMLSLGADRALNLDGGGSSAMYTNKDGELVLHSRPADLFRPKAKLIRKDYNSIIVNIKT